MYEVKHSSREARISVGVAAAWKPEGRPAAVLLRWFATHWCNYRCPYCRQNHARRQQIDSHWAHCFDNWPVDRWLRAFQRHFQTRRLSLVITGGEPLVDHAPMAELVNGLTAMPTVECIRIDTNASLAMEKFQAFDPRKITLMCTFHPSQTTELRFFQKIDALLSRGFKIGMVNYVLTSETLPDFERRYRSLAQREVPLHPNPLWGSRGAYSSEGLRILQEYLPSFDYGYRTSLRSPLRQACFFPAVAYQMNPWGRLHVGCHRTRAGSFFDDQLPPQFPGPVPCPQTTCVCLDMYSFLADQERNCTTDPLASRIPRLAESSGRLKSQPVRMWSQHRGQGQSVG